MIPRWTWAHIVLVRKGRNVSVYVNGTLDIDTEAAIPAHDLSTFFGGRCDNSDNWEGRLDEIAIFNRALTAAEIRSMGGVK